MSKTVAMLFAACCAVAIPIALASDSPVKGGVVLGALLGLIGAYSLDRRRELKAEAAARTTADARLQVLLHQRKAPGFEVAVQGSKGLRLAWLALILGLALLFNALVAVTSIGLWILGLGFSVAAVFLILLAWPARNKPIIVLSATGFETPWTGVIPWHAVEGIDLREIHVRSARYHMLIFHVPSIRTYHAQFSQMQRMIYQARPASWGPRFQVRLGHASEQPGVVFKLARALWTDATSRTHTWDSHLDEARRFPGMTRGLLLIVFISMALSLVSMLARCMQ